MAAIACAVMLLGAVLVVGRDDDSELPDPPADRQDRRVIPRAVLALFAVLAARLPVRYASKPNRQTCSS